MRINAHVKILMRINHILVALCSSTVWLFPTVDVYVLLQFWVENGLIHFGNNRGCLGNCLMGKNLRTVGTVGAMKICRNYVGTVGTSLNCPVNGKEKDKDTLIGLQ